MKYMLVLIMLLSLLAACGEKKSSTPGGEALQLLALHGLVGKTPAERSKDVKQSEVDRDLLNGHFLRLDKMDKFIGDIYVGVVVSALAYSQDKLEEAVTGDAAVITAGKLDVHFVKQDGRWRIDLDRTIPAELKQRAQDEKARYKAARSLGKSLQK